MTFISFTDKCGIYSKKEQTMDDFMNPQTNLIYASTLFYLITQMTEWHQQLVAHLFLNLQIY